jgi:hypothetical protein
VFEDDPGEGTDNPTRGGAPRSGLNGGGVLRISLNGGRGTGRFEDDPDGFEKDPGVFEDDPSEGWCGGTDNPTGCGAPRSDLDGGRNTGEFEADIKFGWCAPAGGGLGPLWPWLPGRSPRSKAGWSGADPGGFCLIRPY